jgi:hypothetical protein
MRCLRANPQETKDRSMTWNVHRLPRAEDRGSNSTAGFARTEARSGAWSSTLVADSTRSPHRARPSTSGRPGSGFAACPPTPSCKERTPQPGPPSAPSLIQRYRASARDFWGWRVVVIASPSGGGAAARVSARCPVRGAGFVTPQSAEERVAARRSWAWSSTLGLGRRPWAKGRALISDPRAFAQRWRRSP